MHPAFPPDPSPLEVDRVEWVPGTALALRVHLIGRWSDRPVQSAPMLLLREGSRRHGFAAMPAAPAGVLLAFELPNELRPSLQGDLALQLGSSEIALPAAVAGPIAEQADEPAAEVIDRAVLAERRARRAELGEDAVTRRAEAAEQTTATLMAQLSNLEQRLALLTDERAELEAQVAESERRLRAAEQREHAEQQLRIEAQDDLALVRRTDEAEMADLRERLESVTRRAEELSRDVERARRATAEAERAGGALAGERAERERLEQLLDQSRAAAQSELKRLEYELAGRREVHAGILAELAAANAELQRLREHGDAPPPAASSAAVPDDGVLGKRVAALEQRRELADHETSLLRGVLDARSTELEQARLELRQQLVDVIAGMRDALAGDRSSRLDLERELFARERREAELQRLVAEVLRTSASLRTRFEAEIRELEKRMTDRLVSERAEAAEQLHAAQRQIADLEARVLTADDVRAGRDLTLSLRAEAESLRSELARVRALAEHNAEPPAETDAMIGGLDAAASRLREQVAPLEDDLPGEPSLARLMPPASAAEPSLVAAKPGPTAAVTPAPLAPRAADLSLPSAPWLDSAITRMAFSDPVAAARLIVALLPALRPEGLDTAFDVTLEELGHHRVTIGDESTTVEAIDEPSARGVVDFRLAGPPQAFASLIGGGMRRRPKQLRVSGRKRRLRKLAKRLELPLRLADIPATAGVDPGLLLGALVANIEPDWTIGRRFTVAWKVSGEHAGGWHVDVLPGRRPKVAAGMPESQAAAIVYVTEGGLIPLLGGLELPAGDAASVVGDGAVVALLREWFDRAQSLA